MALRPEKLQALGFVPPQPSGLENKVELHVGGPARLRTTPSTASLRLNVRIYGGSLPVGNPQTLRCFLGRDAEVEGIVVRTAHDATCVATIQVPQPRRDQEIVHIWCYTLRAMCGEKQMRGLAETCGAGSKQKNVMRWGFIAVPLSRLLDTGMFGASLCDVDYVCVASCDVWLDDKQLRGRSAMLHDALKVGRQVQVFSYPGHSLAFDAQVVYAHETHPLLKDTNIAEIGHRVFSTVSSSAGQMPMWAFPYEMYRCMRTRVAPEVGVQHLLGLLRAAEFFTGISASTTPNLTEGQLGELLNELATVRPRACCYVLDSSLREDGKEHPLDEWTFITDNPERSLIAYDCEEGSCDGIATLALLTAPALESVVSKHKGLQLLRTAQLRYTPVMAIVTLKMMGTNRYSYHAMVLDLDTNWLENHIDRSGGASLASRTVSASNRRAVPPIAMEFTMYSTGCWQYGEEMQTSSQLFFNSQLSLPLQSSPKAPSQLVQKAQLYGHVHTLFTPTLVDTHGICQLICSHQGRLGVPIQSMMSTATNSDIKMVPLRFADGETLGSLAAQFNHMPQMLPFVNRGANKADAQLEQKNYTSTAIFDAVYRKVDWYEVLAVQEAVKQHIASLNANATISITDVDVGSGMELVRVKAWVV